MTADPTIEAELTRLSRDMAEKSAFAAAMEAIAASAAIAMRSCSGRERCDKFLEADIAETKWLRAHTEAVIAGRMFREALAIRAAAAGAKADRGG